VILFLLTMVLGLGSLTGSVGYARYLRSGEYIRTVEQDLTELLQMPIRIESMSPHSFDGASFGGVSALLGSDGDLEVFRCNRALWLDGQGKDRNAYSLELEQGFFRFEPGFWRSPDYSRLLQTGLGQNFSGLGIERIQLRDIDLIWFDEGLVFRADDTTGEVVILNDGMADATLVAQQLNGSAVGPIEISARFSPYPRFALHHIHFRLPSISLARLELGELVQGDVTEGMFEGQLSYRVTGEDKLIELRGALSDARLEEWTSRVVGGPYRGRADLTIDGLQVRNRLMSSIRFRGTLKKLFLGDFLPALKRPGLEGEFELNIHQASIVGDRVEYLSAEGSVLGVSCEALCDALNLEGDVVGRLDLVIHALQIVEDEIRFADLEIKISPPAGGQGTIDRSLILLAAEELLGISIGSVWPRSFSTLEYTQFGVRLLLERGSLRVFGTHGSEARAILTVRLFGLEVAVINQPKRIYPVPDLLSLLRSEIGGIESSDLRQLIGTESR
jgi:hypothetical protein